MSQIKAEIVGDAISQNGNRITSFLLTYPRIIHSELMTHRVFSRNSASSRAIKFDKMVEAVENNPFIPIAWQKQHKGMQGSEYFEDFQDIEDLQQEWLFARTEAVNSAISMSSRGCTKQLANRLLEPFMWHTTLVTSTTYSNFFDLRCPAYQTKEGLKKSWKETGFDELALPLERLQVNQGQGEIHIMALAEAMYDAYNESVPNKLEKGQWYIPFENRINQNKLSEHLQSLNNGKFVFNEDTIQQAKIEVSVSMCARTSYTVVGEEKDFTYEKQIALHDRMINSKPFHASPFEHCAKNMEDSNSYGNFIGWKQYRQFIEQK